MITATILTKNNEKTLKKTLDSLQDFSEVIVLDCGSTDSTLTIASSYPNVTIHHSSFIGFGPMHNVASNLATHDWILSIDSDEVLSHPLREEICNLQLNPEKIYQLTRVNFFNGKEMKNCSGWNPDHVLRLYNRRETAFSSDLVHEKVLIKELQTQRLTSPLFHTPYLEIGDFLHKMQHYSELFAEQVAKKGKNLPLPRPFS